jgi:hypothetical protein
MALLASVVSIKIATPRVAKIVPRIFRIMVGGAFRPSASGRTYPKLARHGAGDGPRPVRAGSCLAIVFWPECPQRLRCQA